MPGPSARARADPRAAEPLTTYRPRPDTWAHGTSGSVTPKGRGWSAGAALAHAPRNPARALVCACPGSPGYLPAPPTRPGEERRGRMKGSGLRPTPAKGAHESWVLHGPLSTAYIYFPSATTLCRVLTLHDPNYPVLIIKFWVCSSLWINFLQALYNFFSAISGVVPPS